MKVAHVLSILLLLVAMFGVRKALYIEHPDVYFNEHAGTICVDCRL